MTIDELLKPRFKVIADYPGNELPIGLVLELNKWNSGKYEFRYMDDNEEYYYLSESSLQRCTANFKELEWWEERKESDMPEYLSYKNKIIKIDKWFFVGSDLRFHTEKPYLTSGAYRTIPATESEYLNQNQQQIKENEI